MKLGKTLGILLLLTGCSLKVPNAEVCVELPDHSAYCKFTLSDDERNVSQDAWHLESKGRFSLTASDFAKYQKFIEEACIRQKCSKEERRAQRKFLEVMENVSNTEL